MSWGEAVVIVLLVVLVVLVGWCSYGTWWRWRNPIAAEQDDLEWQRRKECRLAERRRRERERNS